MFPTSYPLTSFKLALRKSTAFVELMASQKPSIDTTRTSGCVITAIALSNNIKIATGDTAVFETAEVRVNKQWVGG